MMRLALALEARSSTVYFLTTALGAKLLHAAMGKNQVGLSVVQIDAGSDTSRLPGEPGLEPILQANLAAAHVMEVEVQRLIRLGVTDFVVDWLSFGFVDSIRACGGRYCVSMPSSTLQAEFCAAGELSGDYQSTKNVIRNMMRDTTTLVHGLPRMFQSRSGIHGQIAYVGIFPSNLKAIPQDVEAFLTSPGPPILYVFLGSLTWLSGKELEVLCEALAAPGIFRVIWSLPEGGQENLPTSIVASQDFFLSQWPPQPSVLAHTACSAVLIHGDWGSLTDAIQAGKPVAVLPMPGDQPINAQIVQSMKIGVVISQDGCTLGNMDPKHIQDSIQSLLQDPGISETARTWQQEAAAFGGAAYAAEVVEKHFEQDGTSEESRRELEASVIAFAEDTCPLSFDDPDSDELLPRGSQLEVLLVQSALLLGFADALTWWLLRLRVYRDFQRFVCFGSVVLQNLESKDVCELVALAGAVHKNLLQKAVPLGLASPMLDGEPHRPPDFAAVWLASRSLLQHHVAASVFFAEIFCF